MHRPHRACARRLPLPTPVLASFPALPAALAALLLAVPLSGCATPGEEGDGPQSACPSWVKGPSGHGYQGFFPPDSNITLRTDDRVGEGNLEWHGYPLDRYDLDFHPSDQGGSEGVQVEDGLLEVRFFRNDTGEPLPARGLGGDLGGEARPSWGFAAGVHRNFTLQVEEVAALGGGPAPLRVEWRLQRDLDRDSDTPSFAAVAYHVNFWYLRACP